MARTVAGWRRGRRAKGTGDMAGPLPLRAAAAPSLGGSARGLAWGGGIRTWPAVMPLRLMVPHQWPAGAMPSESLPVHDARGRVGGRQRQGASPRRVRLCLVSCARVEGCWHMPGPGRLCEAMSAAEGTAGIGSIAPVPSGPPSGWKAATQLTEMVQNVKGIRAEWAAESPRARKRGWLRNRQPRWRKRNKIS